jgi:hypothetical protein
VRSDNCDDYSAEHNYEDRSRRIVSRPAGSGSLLPSVGGPQLVREPRLARVAEYKNHTRAVPGRRRLYPTRGAWPKQFWSASTLQLLECKGPDGPACLTAAQVEAARTVYSPATNPRTKQQISAGLVPGGELGWAAQAGPQLGGIPNGHFKYVVFKDPNWDYRTLRLRSRPRFSYGRCTRSCRRPSSATASSSCRYVTGQARVFAARLTLAS